MAELRHSLQQERRKTEALARDLAASRRTPGAGDTPEPGATLDLQDATSGESNCSDAGDGRGGPRWSGGDEVDRTRQRTA